MIDNVLVGNTISTLRQARGLTQQQLASSLDVSHQAVSKWETGQAIPDIDTLLAIADLFGVTVDQILRGSIPTCSYAEAEQPDQPKAADIGAKVKSAVQDLADRFDMAADPKFDIGEGEPADAERLIKAAPFMTRAALEKELFKPGVTLNADQIRRLAPYIGSDCLERLIEKSEIRISWDFLTRVAPFMKREVVDRMVAAAQKGIFYVKPTIDPFAKTFDDLGRTIGTTVTTAFKGVNELVSQIFTPEPKSPASFKSDVAQNLFLKAAEKALEEKKWDWLEAHIAQISDPAFLSRIADAAIQAGEKDWVCRNIPTYADCGLTLTALSQGNWDWLGLMARELTGDGKQKVLEEVAAQGKWDWLNDHLAELAPAEQALALAQAAIDAGRGDVACAIAECCATEEEVRTLAERALAEEKADLLARFFPYTSEGYRDSVLTSLAACGKWDLIALLAPAANQEKLAELLESAISAGEWNAIDRLSELLK